jgi:putative addiction module killer protein
MEVIFYADEAGNEPLTKWLHRLRSVQARSIILARLRRIATTGVLGDYKSVGKGVGEFRIDHGPGYRIYAYRDGPLLLLLLSGSAKADQQAGIAQAAAYLKDWKQRNA